jgi:outer membrane receptor for ferrienterochelin and colicins
MSKKYYCLIALAFLCNAANAQTLKGFVGDNSEEPVIGATIYWTNAPSKGVATDVNGQFTIPTIKGEKTLIISAVGFTTDSVEVSSTDFLKITLSESSETLK